MKYIIISVLLFSFNNVLWKKNLQHTNTYFLISFRAFINSIVSILLLIFVVNSWPSINDFIKITLGSALGVIGLLCMLTAIKKNSLQWLGIYNLLGVLIIYFHLYFWEGLKETPSYLGLASICIGYMYYLIINSNKAKKLTLKTHLLLLIMVFCFSYSSIIHWKNLTSNINPLFILTNQELLVFIVSSLLLSLNFKKEIYLGNYKKNFQKVFIMSILIIIAIYTSFKGIKITDPLINSLLFLASPLTTILFSAIFFKEKITFKHVISIFLICIGAFLIHLKTT